MENIYKRNKIKPKAHPVLKNKKKPKKTLATIPFQIFYNRDTSFINHCPACAAFSLTFCLRSFSRESNRSHAFLRARPTASEI